MYFVGDIALPTTKLFCCDAVHFDGPVIGNLEGPLCLEPAASLLREPVVFNDVEVLDELRNLGFKAFSLANNHILDLGPTALSSTVAHLSKEGYGAFGVHLSRYSGALTWSHIDEGVEVAHLGYGWRTIGCRSRESPGVSPMTADAVLHDIRAQRERLSGTRIAVHLHCNYELELWPQPAHRRLAQLCIEEGADIVICHHPHCVGGGETHLGKPILYSLGNWLFPSGLYHDGALSFPSFTRLQLAAEWSPSTNKCRLHWYEYHCSLDSRVHRLSFLQVEDFRTSRLLADRTPFRGMSHGDYRQWFRRHRRKKLLLPVYDEPDSPANILKDAWVLSRHKGIRLLASLGLKRGPK